MLLTAVATVTGLYCLQISKNLSLDLTVPTAVNLARQSATCDAIVEQVIKVNPSKLRLILLLFEYIVCSFLCWLPLYRSFSSVIDQHFFT